jgi:hypothetical protein
MEIRMGIGLKKAVMMKLIFAVVTAGLLFFITGCASVPAAGAETPAPAGDDASNQAIFVNVLDTLLGAGIGMLAGTLCGGAITLGTNGRIWPGPLDGRFYIPIYAGTAAGGIMGWLLSPKTEEVKK